MIAWSMAGGGEPLQKPTPLIPVFRGKGVRCFIKKDQESFRSMGISYNTS